MECGGKLAVEGRSILRYGADNKALPRGTEPRGGTGMESHAGNYEIIEFNQGVFKHPFLSFLIVSLHQNLSDISLT